MVARLQVKNGRILISRAGENVETIDPLKSLFNSDYSNLRQWAHVTQVVPKSNQFDFFVQPYSAQPNDEGVSAPKTLTMFRPNGGGHTYQRDNSDGKPGTYVARGYLMAFMVNEAWHAGDNNRLWGVKVEDAKNSDDIRFGNFSHLQNMEISIAVFNNNLG